MKNVQQHGMLATGICETNFSKRTIITFMAGLKERISEPVQVIQGGEISTYHFTGVTNKDGCVLLNGCEVHGRALLDILNEHQPEGAFSEKTKQLLETLKIIGQAGAVLHSRTGSYPPLFLNGTYIDFESKRVSLIPEPLMDLMKSYLNAEIQKSIRFVLGDRSDSPSRGEFDFTRSLAKLLYLFTAQPHLSHEEQEPFYYLADVLSGTPKLLADAVWDATHGRNVSLERFNTAIDDAMQDTKQDAKHPTAAPAKLPLFRTRGFIRFSRAISRALSRRLKLIIVILVSLSLIFYLLVDFIIKSKKLNYTIGLSPEQVIELYYRAEEDLNMDVVESIFYRRAGKEVINELSALFVMTKLETLYQRPEALQTGLPRILDIIDLKINQIENDQNPVFEARYKKIINTVDRKSEYSVKEVLVLKEIDKRWYIIKITRESIEQ